VYTKTAKAANRKRWSTTIDPTIKRRLFAQAGVRDLAVNELLEELLDQLLPQLPGPVEIR
jgi:hypothetical protein